MRFLLTRRKHLNKSLELHAAVNVVAAKRFAAFLLTVGAGAVVLGYAVGPLLLSTENQPPRLLVVASFYPLQEFTKRLVDPDVRVVTLIPAGVEPHDWEPRPGDAVLLTQADLLLYVHPEFETSVVTLLAAGDTPPPFVIVSDGLELKVVQHEGEEEVDPHIWLDPVLAQHIVLQIRDGLIRVDPAMESAYRQRAHEVLSELRNLHEEISIGLRDCRIRTFIASHAAFSYFSQRYDLTMEAITTNPEAEPSPSRLEQLIDYARALGITVIYKEPLVSGGPAEVIAEEIGGSTLTLDPIEVVADWNLETGPNYFTLMLENLQNLRTGLGCSG
jgi:zinc transport system substrate-binding protein